MPNPFTMRVIPPDAPFCNRTEELKDLSRHAVNQASVVLFSPRRYGKTSLVKKVQHEIEEKAVFFEHGLKKRWKNKGVCPEGSSVL